ncbi:MAG: efflux transporter outer membrane subunit [Methylococcales bacterium]|nr:MAG: efflux transporter outer membrane subunit [Methylococcales bacterium]
MNGRSLKSGLIPAFMMLTSCMVGPDFIKPKAPAVERYTQDVLPNETMIADGLMQHFELGAKVNADWWRLFKSTQLNIFVSKALANNLTLQSAQANLRQSQANLQAGYGVFFPQIDAGFTPVRQQFSPARFGNNSASSIFNLYTFSTTVSYTLDVFGGERRNVESLEAQKDLQRYTEQGTYLTLTGNIINAVIAKAAYQAEVETTEQWLALLQKQIKLTETQVSAGTVSYQAVVSLRSQLALVAATLPALKQKLNQTEHLQANLVGLTPADWQSPTIKLADLTLPLNIPVSLPSELVHQRPDILAAEAQLHSDSAKIGVATAGLFPNISLSGSFGYNNQSLLDLFMSKGNIWSMAANFAQPLFHGGTLWFGRKAAIATHEKSLAIYQQTVVSAFTQVADALSALQHDAELVAAQRQSLEAADDALRLVTANYQAGLVNTQQVLIIESQRLQAKLAYLSALAQRYQDTVAFFVALGGGL